MGWRDRQYNKILDRLNLIRKDAVYVKYHMTPEGEPRNPDYNLVALYDELGQSWIMQDIFRALIQETRRSGWELQPRFVSKCDNCGVEYQVLVKKCENCGSEDISPPDPFQRKRAIDLIRHPNSDRENFFTIMGSLTYHDLASDDWYLSVEYAPTDGGRLLVPKEIKVQDPRYIKPCLDEYLNLGKDEYFCPVCFNKGKETPKNVYSLDQFKALGERCPDCGTQLLKTFYLQEVSSQVLARWGPGQIVHGSTHRILPTFFGTPRTKAIWSIIQVIRSMDNWFFDYFKEARMEKIVNFPHSNQRDISELEKRIEADRMALTVIDPYTGVMRSKLGGRVYFVSSNDPLGVYDVGVDPQRVQALDYYKMAIQACAGVFGVQAIYISFMEQGRTGVTPSLQLEVQEKTILEIQHDKEESLNEQLFPIFGIYDWIFKFKPLEKRDKMREAEIEQRTASAAMTYRNAGFEVWFDEFGILQKSNNPGEVPEGKRTDGELPKHTTSEASGMDINETSTEREPHGRRPYSPGVERP